MKLQRYMGQWLHFNYIDETGEHAVMTLPINGLHCFEDTARERVAIMEAYREREKRERQQLCKAKTLGRVVVELHTFKHCRDRAMLLIHLPDEHRTMVGLATIQLSDSVSI